MACFFTWILTTKRKSFFSLVVSSYLNSGTYRQKNLQSSLPACRKSDHLVNCQRIRFFYPGVKRFFGDCFNCALSPNDVDFLTFLAADEICCP